MRYLVFSLLVLLAVGLSFSANVDSCQVINAGGLYTLNQSIVGGTPQPYDAYGPTCIGINVSNVVLNCAGHTIDAGLNTTMTTGIIAAQSNNTASLNNVTIANCTVTGNFSTLSVDTAGIEINNVENSTLRGNTVIDIPSGSAGFLLKGSNHGTLVTNNTAGNINANGFDMEDSTDGGNTLTNNVASNSTVGFEINSDSNKLTNNLAFSNGDQGFHVWSTNNTVADNTAHDNGFTQSGFYGGFIVECCGPESNNLSHNTAFSNTGSGFYQYYSTGTLYADNLAYGNSENGFQIDGDPATLRSNTAHGNSLDGFFLQDGDGNNLSLNTAYGNGQDGYRFSFDNDNNITNNTAHDNGNNGFNVMGSSGNLIDKGVAYGQTSGDGFLINSNFAASFNNITNSLAYNNDIGFELNGEDNAYLADNTAHNNFFAGFELDNGGFSNTLIHNTAYNNTNPQEGCFFFFGPASAGFLIDGSSGNALINNTAHDNNFLCTSFPSNVNNLGPQFVPSSFPTGYGFYVSSFSGLADDNNLTGNTAYNNGVAGFGETQQVAASNNLYTDDLAYSNMYGFQFFGDDSNVLTNVTAHTNSIAGLFESTCTSPAMTVLDSSLYNNGWEVMQASSCSVPFTMNNTMLGSSINLTVVDEVGSGGGGYNLNETAAPGPAPAGLASFRGKYLKVNFTGDLGVNSTTFHWRPNEATGFNESSIALYTWNLTGWILTPNQTVDPATHSLTVLNLINITSDDIYGLFAQTNSTTVPGGNPSGGSSLGVSMASNCSGNVVTVSSGGPVQGADVLVDGNSIGTTDQNGQASFQGCGSSVTIRASKSGFQDAVTSSQEIACGQCAPPKCTTDADCASDQKCQINDNASLNQCVPLQCSCGQIASNHQCTGAVYQCGIGANCATCPSGQMCNADHQCVPSGCTSDLQCQNNEVCRTSSGAPGTSNSPGSCKPLCADGSNSCQCSQAENHTLVPLGYECGTEPGCQSCPSGQSCVDHKCIQNDINCPTSVVVGANGTCTLTQNNQACGPNDNCTAVVTTPDGKNVTLTPDENGNIVVPGSISGRVKVDLLKDGQVVKEVFVDIVPKSQPGEQPPPSSAGGADLFSLLWLLLLLLVVIGAVIYWRSRGQKK